MRALLLSSVVLASCAHLRQPAPDYVLRPGRHYLSLELGRSTLNDVARLCGPGITRSVTADRIDPSILVATEVPPSRDYCPGRVLLKRGTGFEAPVVYRLEFVRGGPIRTPEGLRTTRDDAPARWDALQEALTREFGAPILAGDEVLWKETLTLSYGGFALDGFAYAEGKRRDSAYAEHDHATRRCESRNESPPYFRLEMLASKASVARSYACWFAAHLEAMGEAPLSAARGDVYRFLWLRTFDPPIAVRVEPGPAGYVVTAKVLDGKGGYAPGKLIEERRRRLSHPEWAEFQAALSRGRFWDDTPGYEPEVDAFDGSEWVLEAVRDGRHRLVRVYMPLEPEAPPRARAIADAASRLLRAAGFEPHVMMLY